MKVTHGDWRIELGGALLGHRERTFKHVLGLPDGKGAKVLQAWSYVRDQIDFTFDEEDPLLPGALLTLLRAIENDPFIHCSPDAPDPEAAETAAREWLVYRTADEPNVMGHCPVGWFGDNEVHAIACAILSATQKH